MGALAGPNGGDGAMGGAGTEGGEGGSSFASTHRSFGPLKNAETSSMLEPTYTLGLPFSDSPAMISKVVCTAAAKPRARICRSAVDRLNRVLRAEACLGYMVLEPAAPAPSRP
eukprot:scaffold18942_cov63-Phaeocystis_antarctica.AAC.12